MHAANIDKSERLQRVLSALRSWGQLSTMEIVRVANVCAVNSAVAELRCNGYDISCEKREGVFYYRLEA